MKKKGFTVIEMLVVMLLVGLLFVLAAGVRNTGEQAAQQWVDTQRTVVYIQAAEKVEFETRYGKGITDGELLDRINKKLNDEYKVESLEELPDDAINILKQDNV